MITNLDLCNAKDRFNKQMTSVGDNNEWKADKTEVSQWQTAYPTTILSGKPRWATCWQKDLHVLPKSEHKLSQEKDRSLQASWNFPMFSYVLENKRMPCQLPVWRKRDEKGGCVYKKTSRLQLTQYFNSEQEWGFSHHQKVIGSKLLIANIFVLFWSNVFLAANFQNEIKHKKMTAEKA